MLFVGIMGELGERGLHVIRNWCDSTAVASDGLENGNDNPPRLCVLEALLSVELSLALPHSPKNICYPSNWSDIYSPVVSTTANPNKDANDITCLKPHGAKTTATSQNRPIGSPCVT